MEYCNNCFSECMETVNGFFCLFTLLPGSFHLIHLMFDDYVLYLLESLHCQEKANELMRAMKGEGSTGESVLLFIICCFIPLFFLLFMLGHIFVLI